MGQSNVNHVALLGDLRTKLREGEQVTEADVQKAAQTAKALGGHESRMLYSKMKKAAAEQTEDE